MFVLETFASVGVFVWLPFWCVCLASILVCLFGYQLMFVFVCFASGPVCFCFCLCVFALLLFSFVFASRCPCFASVCVYFASVFV